MTSAFSRTCHTPSMHIGGVVRATVAVILSLGLGACTSQDRPRVATSAFERGESLVFLSLEENIPDVNLELRYGRTYESGDRATVVLADISLSESVAFPTTWVTFDGVDGDGRWAGMLVRPGTYYLKVLPPKGRDAPDRAWDWRRNRYLLRVEEGGRAFYAGHFVADCEAKGGLFGGTFVGHCRDELERRVDLEDARRAMRAWLPEIAVDAVDLTPLDDAASLAVLPLQSTQVDVRGPALHVPPPNWERFDNVTKPDVRAYLGPWLAPSSAGLNLSGCYGAGCAAMILLVGAVAGTVWAASEIDASSERNEWSACFAGLRKSALAYPLRERIGERLAVAGTPAPGENTSELTIDVYRIAARKCAEPETVCAEVALRVRFGDRGGMPTFEKFYVYTADEFAETPGSGVFASLPAYPWWEHRVPGAATPRHIMTYCGSDPEQTFATEIDAAIEALMTELASDLGGG